MACPYRFLAAKRQAKEVFPRAIRTTELPSNPLSLSTRDGAQLTFRNNQIQILQTSSTLGTTQPWQPTSLSKLPTHTARGFHTNARTYNAGQRDKSPDSPVTPSRTGGEINVVLQQQRMVRVDCREVNWDLSLASHNMCASSLFLWRHRSQSLCSMFMYEGLGTYSLDYCILPRANPTVIRPDQCLENSG